MRDRRAACPGYFHAARETVLFATLKEPSAQEPSAMATSTPCSSWTAKIRWPLSNAGDSPPAVTWNCDSIRSSPVPHSLPSWVAGQHETAPWIMIHRPRLSGNRSSGSVERWFSRSRGPPVPVRQASPAIAAPRASSPRATAPHPLAAFRLCLFAVFFQQLRTDDRLGPRVARVHRPAQLAGAAGLAHGFPNAERYDITFPGQCARGRRTSRERDTTTRISRTTGGARCTSSRCS